MAKKRGNTINIELKESSQSIKYKNVLNTYQRGAFFCILTSDNYIDKYPIANVWRVREYYENYTFAYKGA